MPVTVNQTSLEAEELGLQTVGQVLNHVQKDDRLVVHILLDGKEPNLSRMGTLRNVQLDGHCLYIETADPRLMALKILAEVETGLHEADRLKLQAADSLQMNQPAKAMENLGGCFRAWQNAQESVTKIAQLLRIDLDQIRLGDLSMPQMLKQFNEQLRQIKSSLENRDYVALSDTLLYETAETGELWRAALDAMRDTINK